MNALYEERAADLSLANAQLARAARLIKPIDRQALEQALRRVLAHSGELLVTAALVVASPQRRPKILLVEDNEANIEAMSDYLTSKGYVVMGTDRD